MDRLERLQHAIREALGESANRDPLDALADLEILDSFVDEYAQARVDDARAAGASWAQIAERLGVSRQAAHKRFGKKRAGLELRLVFEKKKQ